MDKVQQMDNAQQYATANLPLPLTALPSHQHVDFHLPTATVSKICQYIRPCNRYIHVIY
jgi:hypothetical protein